MSNVTKKLLSMLVVMVMVLSMIPAQPIHVHAENVTDFSGADDDGKVNTWCPVCNGNKDWFLLTEATSGNENLEGHYYVLTGETVSNTEVYNWGTKTTACVWVDGTISSTTSVFKVGHNSTLNLMGEGTLEGAGTDGGVLNLQSCYVNLYDSLTLKMVENTDYQDNGIVWVSKTGTPRLSIYDNVVIDGDGKSRCVRMNCASGEGDAGGYVEMHGGTIQNGCAPDGGNVYITTAKSRFTMYGGTVQGGTSTRELTSTKYASAGGGNIYVSEGELEINGANAVIEDGVAKVNGGNIMATSGAKVTMTAGTVRNGASQGESGYTASCGLAGGGNIHANGSNTTVTINGGSITGGTAKRGGNICAVSGAKVTVDGADAQITVGTPLDTVVFGANVFVRVATFELKNGTLTGQAERTDTDGDQGGNLYMHSGTVNINGGLVTGGKAKYGGNIQVGQDDSSGTATLNLNGGTVSGGVATADGGNIRVKGHANGTYKVEMNGSIISGGQASLTAQGNGGNVHLAQGTFDLKSGTISGGNCQNYGANISIWGGTLNMTGGVIDATNSDAKNGTSIGIRRGTANLSGGTIKNNEGSAVVVSGNETGGLVKLSGTVTFQDNNNKRSDIYFALPKVTNEQAAADSYLQVAADFTGKARVGWEGITAKDKTVVEAASYTLGETTGTAKRGEALNGFTYAEGLTDPTGTYHLISDETGLLKFHEHVTADTGDTCTCGETYVAYVAHDTTAIEKYVILQEALKAAVDKDTIVLQQDCTMPVNYIINDGRNITIDLNGYDITANGIDGNGNRAFMIRSGHLTITDNNPDKEGCISVVGRDAEGVKDTTYLGAVIFVYPNKTATEAKFTLNGGIIDGLGNDSGALTENFERFSTVVGTWSETDSAAGIFPEITIEGGEVKATKYGAILIQGNSKSELNITGGKITGKVTEWHDANAAVRGGIYTEEPSHLSECYMDNGDGTFTVKADKHSYSSEITADPDCVTAGTRTFTCSTCGNTYTEPVEATGHKMIADAKAEYLKSEATCTAAAVYYKSCSECGAKSDETFTTEKNPNNHEDLTQVDAKAPTCTETGNVAHYACFACGKNFEDEAGEKVLETIVVPATGHSHSEAWKNNETHHWHECFCGDKADVAEHGYDQNYDTTCDTCGCVRELPINFVAANTTTHRIYENIADALANAEGDQTIILLRNVESKIVTVLENTTLDLNGFTLTANYVASFGDIVDNSTANTGVLKVAKNRIMLQASNDQLPIYNAAAGGYQFFVVSEFKQAIHPTTGKYHFQPIIEAAARDLLLLGAASSGVTINVRVSWTQADGKRNQDFVYNDGLVEKFLEAYDPNNGKYGKDYSLLLKVADAKVLSIRPVVVSDTGVEFYGADWQKGTE